MGAFLSQLSAIGLLGIRTLPARLGTALMTVVGIAGVVAALLVVLSIAAGLRDVMRTSAVDDAVIVMRTGSDNEMASSLDLVAVRAISDAPEIAVGGVGPVLSAEIVVVVDVRNRSTGTDGHVPLRGVGPLAQRLRPDFHVIEGRMFEPGRRELIVGRGVAAHYAGLDVGGRPNWGETSWEVVGHFVADGSVAESEIWSDVHVLQPIYGFGSSVHTVYAELAAPDLLAPLQRALEKDPRTSVRVERLSDFYGRQTAVLTATLQAVGAIAGALMGICAVFGALNTMYAAVASRSREIATLRAIGFGAWPAAISVVLESLAVAAFGGALGVGIAWMVFDGIEASTMNWATYTQVAFSFSVDGPLAAQGVTYALAIGLVGGLLPAVRAARLPIATALREA